MRHLLLTMLSDITESLRARWFMIYTAVFVGSSRCCSCSGCPSRASSASWGCRDS